MKSFMFKILATAIIVMAFFSVCCFASDALPTEGYCYTSTPGVQSNVKWTITTVDDVVTLRFEIDPTATDKVQSTAITAFASDGTQVGYGNNHLVPWFNDGVIHHIVIGDGITEAYGGVLIKVSLLLSVEVPASFTKTTGAVFESSSKLTKFYVRGTEAKEGVCDLTYFTHLGNYIFDNAKFTEIIWGENLTAIPNEAFKVNNFRELDIPDQIKIIGSKAFDACGKLKKVTINNPDCNIAGNAFTGCPLLFTLVGYKGSTAQNYAETYGFEFVDIETGEIILEGTREVEKDPEEVWIWKREEADDGGNLYQEYKGNRLIDTDWAWYADAKTLVFFDNKAGGYNETGSRSAVSDSGTHWSDYADQIEEIWIQAGIDKISGGAFRGLPNLRIVQIGAGVYQMDGNAFLDCTSLRSIYRIGLDPEDGVADLSSFGKISSGVLRNTGIESVKLKNGITDVNASALLGCKNIISQDSEYLRNYCKLNYFNLVSPEDGSIIYENYRYINAAELISAGTAAVASFDAETGTLTVFGSGEVYDIANYYGGGSKTAPWFSIKNDIKKIVFGSEITIIGKYAFCQCKNLEYVELPDSPIAISSAAFEKCYNLRAVYTTGNEPVIGTFDLRNVSVLESWSFAYTYLLANPIISPEVTEIGSSTFENCMNITNIYGTPGSYAETYAAEKGKTFVDIASGMPENAICTPPAMNQDEQERAERHKGDEETDAATETVNPLYEEPNVEFYNDGNNGANVMSDTVIIIAVSAVIVVVIAIVLLLIVKKKVSK
ncbi:MAG: leucine-rich repeat protein [Clostridia bacterium]|nr:leucine-rich repeat protein [Clostridia bacterium]